MGDTYDLSGDFRGATVNIKSDISYGQATPAQVAPATLAAAQEQLAALPLDHIPPPTSLPPGSRMPHSPNPLFVGRQTNLRALAAALKGGQTAAIGQIAAATGLGGIGKTQLAAEFVHRYGQYFAGGVFWLSFGIPEAIPAEIAACGGPGGLDLRPDFGSLPLPDQMRLVLSAWQSPLPRLLVFDNCEDEAPLAQWRPPSGGSRVLVTSRRGRWARALGVRELPLDVLERAESVALLRGHRPDLAPLTGPGQAGDPLTGPGQAADAISDELGDLPLALHLAGSFLETYRDDPLFGDPADFLAQLRDKRLLDHPALQGEDVTHSPTGHDLHVGRTFTLSYRRLDANDPADVTALALLGRAAYFAPGEPIPRELLLATLDLEADDREQARQAARGLRRLVALGLLEQEQDGTLLLHRLLAAFGQGVAGEGAQGAVEGTVLQAMSERMDQAQYIAPLLLLQPHLRAVTDAAMEREEKRAGNLCNWLGYYLKQIGDYDAARPYYERALAIREKVLGAEHPDTASSLNNLGALLQATGDYDAARPYYERALAINEKVLGAEHPDTASSLNNLGFLLQATGDYDAARPYLERALAIREKVLGAEHPDTALSLNNLGFLLDSTGDYAAARPYYERALAIFEARLGPDHPNTRTVRSNLAALDAPPSP